MPRLPQEPEAFAEVVADLVRKLNPRADVELVGPRELIVDGRRMDLENLFRMVSQDPDRGSEIAGHYLEQIFASDAMQIEQMPFDLARDRVMPRIQPESIFEHLNRELVAHVPFVNDTVIVFVTDLPQMTVSITTEQVVRWGLTAEELEPIARRNLERYAPNLHIRFIESKDGGRAAIVSEQDGYDAARLLLRNLFGKLSPSFGGDFFVAAPSRDMFVALSVEPGPFVDRLRNRVDQDFRRLPYPITNDLFYVTRDGVAGTRQAA
ncbi:MAG: DUF1444 family protein [Phycisphaeraceae bacterium]|nr:DUF1444 family protein [Phycisphaeraceae bacterium]